MGKNSTSGRPWMSRYLRIMGEYQTIDIWIWDFGTLLVVVWLGLLSRVSSLADNIATLSTPHWPLAVRGVEKGYAEV